MSVLETPRAYFNGSITWDPILTNNYDSLWDLEQSKPLFNESNGTTVAAYRQTAADSVLDGNWNPDGTHRCELFDAHVSAVDIGDGYTTDDGFVGVPVNLLAMLVDVNSYITNTSLMFYDDMTWGIDGGNRIAARRDKRMTGSHINFARNTGYQVIAGVASVFWQASFPWANLRLDDRGSNLVQKFKEYESDPDVLGLTMRMNTYRTVYYGNYSNTKPTAEQQQALRDAILGGGFHPNPAVSVLVGTLGLWRKGEPAVVPGDRFLTPASASLGVASAYARAQGDKLWIDLSNSLPETNFELHKKNFGNLSVTATTPDGTETAIGTLGYADYDKDAYEKTSGLVYLDLDTEAKRAAVAGGVLSVSSDTDGAMFAERRFHACPEHPSLYLDDSEVTSVDVLVLDRGASPGKSVKMTVAVLGSTANPEVVTTDADGRATIALRGGSPGESPVFLGAWQDDDTPPTVPPSANDLNSDTDAYISLRVWPLDSEVAALEPTWANVHEHVLRDWEALAPCMDNWLLLGDEQQCEAYAGIILRLTSDDFFENYRYMPVTRGMTAGQRTLLHGWCHKVLGTEMPAKAAQARSAAPRAAVTEVAVGGMEETNSAKRREFQRRSDSA